MKYYICLLLVGLMCASCTHVSSRGRGIFAGPATDFENPSRQIFEFDLLKDYQLVTSVDVIILKGWTNHDPFGDIVYSNKLVVADAKCDIDKIISNVRSWPFEDFTKLFLEFDPKRKYEPCFCAAKYVMAAYFYVQTDDRMDPFGMNGRTHTNRVAVALLDEAHDSILISDMKHGPRDFRFSIGHSPDSQVPQFIGKVMRDLGLNYVFMKEIKEP